MLAPNIWVPCYTWQIKGPVGWLPCYASCMKAPAKWTPCYVWRLKEPWVYQCTLVAVRVDLPWFVLVPSVVNRAVIGSFYGCNIFRRDLFTEGICLEGIFLEREFI